MAGDNKCHSKSARWCPDLFVDAASLERDTLRANSSEVQPSKATHGHKVVLCLERLERIFRNKFNQETEKELNP
jgi:hypothetical protein